MTGRGRSRSSKAADTTDLWLFAARSCVRGARDIFPAHEPNHEVPLTRHHPLCPQLPPGCDDGAKDEVRAVFDAYNAARDANDAAAAMKVIDPENIKHYDYLVDIARSGARDQIQRLRPRNCSRSPACVTA
jgi:hypothetical protein